MEFKELDLRHEAVGGVEGEEICLEVGDGEREAVAVGEGNLVDYLAYGSFLVEDEPGALDELRGVGDGVDLRTAGEVIDGVVDEYSLDGVVFVWRAFLAAACLISFCHDFSN